MKGAARADLERPVRDDPAVSGAGAAGERPPAGHRDGTSRAVAAGASPARPRLITPLLRLLVRLRRRS